MSSRAIPGIIVAKSKTLEGGGTAGESKPAVEVLPIEAVQKDPRNARLHPDRNREAIRRSLRSFRSGRSLVLDGTNTVRAGNGTIEEAAAEGFDEILVIEPKPNQLVAVRRSDWTEAQAVGYGIADNKTTDTSMFDYEALGELVIELGEVPEFDLTDLGFSDGELEMIQAAEWTPPEPDGSTGTEGADAAANGKVALTFHVLPEQKEVILRVLKEISDDPGEALVQLCESSG